MAGIAISAQEQLMLELINGARLDPAGTAASFDISLNNGHPAGTFANRSYEPLAWNGVLTEVAAEHVAWQFETDNDGYYGPDGRSLHEIAFDAGYEPLYAGGTYRLSAWATWSLGYPGDRTATEMIRDHFQVRFAGYNTEEGWVDDTRDEILGNYTDYGAGQEFGTWTDKGWDITGETSLYVHFLGDSGGTFVTGVAYADHDGDRFYDVGGGLGGVTWDRLDDGKAATASMRAGGYNVATPHTFAGWTTFEVRHGISAMRLEIQLAQANAKLDYLGNATFASAVDLDLGAGARNGVLLGVGALSLEGTGGANRLDGNRGANVISGEAGNDMLRGREGADALLGGDSNDTMRGDEGNDRLEGGAGADRLDGGRGNDVLVGGFGADVFAFDRSGSAIGSDSLRLKSDDVIRIDLEGALPAEVAWEAAHIARVADGFRVALGDGDTIHIVTALSLGAVTDALILI